MPNYFNPAATQPQMPDWLQAYHAPEQMQRYREFMAIQKQMQQTAASQQQAEHNTYNLDAPVRAAQRPAQISGFQLGDTVNKAALNQPGYGQAIAQGKMGESMQQYAQGQHDMQTLPGKVGATNAGNDQKTTDSQLKSMESFASFLDSNIPMLQEAEKEGGLNAEIKYRELLNKIPPNVRSRFPENYKQAKQVLPRMYQRLTENMEHVRKMQETQYKELSATQRSQIQAQAQIQRAQMNLTQRQKTALQELQSARTPQGQIGAATRILADPDLEEYHGIAQQVRDQAYQVLATGTAARYGQGIPGTPFQTPSVEDIVRQLNVPQPGAGGQPQPGGSGITPRIRRYDSQGNPIR